MNGYNDNITHDQLAKLRQLFPEVFTEDRIDWARLKATLGDAVNLGERYGLGWKGKSDVFRQNPRENDRDTPYRPSQLR